MGYGARQSRPTGANLNSARTTTQKYVNFFVQDSWRVGDRLTVNPGLRYEQEKLAGTLVTDFALKNNWAPRLGAAYDITGDGKTKVFGNYGYIIFRRRQKACNSIGFCLSCIFC